MKIIENFTEEQVNQMLNLFQQAWWSNTRTLEDIKIMVQNTNLLLGVIDENNNLIGFSRALTDTTFKAYILDVIIDDNHRNNGIGKILIEMLLKHPKIKNVKHVELICKNELMPFYAKWGFKAIQDDVHFVRRTRI